MAIRFGKYTAAKYLIKQKADINICDICGDNPLSLSYRTWFGTNNMVKAFDRLVFQVNAKNKKEDTTLNLTKKVRRTREGHKIINLLLDNGSNVNILDQSGYPPLAYLHNYISENLAKKFILKGADLSLKIPGGKTIYDVMKRRFPNLFMNDENQEKK